MKIIRRPMQLSIPFLAVLALLSCEPEVAVEGASGGGDVAGVTAIVGGAILDPAGGAALENAVLLVKDGLILEFGPHDDVAVPPEATVIDATGGFLLPGFIDAHAHVGLGPVLVSEAGGVPALEMVHDPGVAHRSLLLLLAHGVTTALDPGGATDVLLDLRDRMRDGGLNGPDLRVAGHIIDLSPFPGLVATVSTPEDVSREVARQADAGVDFIKLYAFLSPEMVAAGVATAEARGVPVLIHPFLTTWTEAARLGVDAVLHITPGSLDLVPETAREGLLADMQLGTLFMFTWFEVADLHGPEMSEAIAALAERRVAVDPTLVFFDMTMRSDDPAVTRAEELRWVAPSLVENWRTTFHMTMGWTEDDFDRARAAWPRMLELTRLLHEAGVPLTAGTDANNPWIIPGVSFHREFELLVEAGLSPLEVLGIATRGNARHAGVLEDRGTIEAGKRADLVLLRSDPRDDISATQDIEWVMKGGTLRRPEELLAEVDSVGSPSDYPPGARPKAPAERH